MTTSSTSPPSSAEERVPRSGVHRLGTTPVRAWWSGRAHGDQRSVASGTLPRAVPFGLTVQRLRQVHGAEVVVVEGPGADMSGPPEADAVIGAGTESCLVVLTADCAPVALGSPEGIHGAVHVGWRGLEAGVIARAVAAMKSLGASAVVGGLGPTIHSCCYRFSPEDLEAVAGAVGDEVRGVTTDGEPALDLPAGVRSALARAGVGLVVEVDRCTACGPDAFSYRARKDEARQAVFVWNEGRVPP